MTGADSASGGGFGGEMQFRFIIGNLERRARSVHDVFT